MKFNLAYLVILAGAALAEGKCVEKVRLINPEEWAVWKQTC